MLSIYQIIDLVEVTISLAFKFVKIERNDRS